LVIYEISPTLKKIQKKELLNSDVNWINDLKKIKKIPSIFVANEFFDALAIKQFEKKGNLWFEKFVSLNKKITSFSEKNNFKIFAFPFLSVLCAVLGGLLSRMVFLQNNLSPFLTTEIRLLGAIIFLISLKGFKINFFLKNIDKKQQKRFFISILLGTNIGIFLQQVVFKTLPIGVGWALLSISPVISLFFAKTEEREITKKIIFFTCFLFFGLTLIIL